MWLRLIFTIICSPILAFARANTFFDIAVSQNQVVIKRIKAHPFNVALNRGNLSQKKV